MSGVRLVGGRVLDPVSGVDEVRDLCWSQGKVAAGGADLVEVDCSGKLVMPGFIDLGCWTAAGEGTGQRAAGIAFSVVHPGAQLAGPGVALGPLTIDLAGEELADASAHRWMGQGLGSFANAAVLRNALDYAASLGRGVFLRAWEPSLERSGVVEGPQSARLGLPGTPRVSEAIAVHRVAELARLTGCRVHLTHLWSADGVEGVRSAKAAGSPVTGSTTAMALVSVAEHMDHQGRWRLHVPLGEHTDRAALIAGLQDGTLDGIASDHRSVSWASDVHPLQDAPAGAHTLDVLGACAFAALGPAGMAASLVSRPASVLGLRPTLLPGSTWPVVVFDPEQAPSNPPGRRPSIPRLTGAVGRRLDA